MGQKPEPSRPQTTEWYRLLIDEVQDYAIFLIDLEGRVVGWNEGAERLLGWSEGGPMSCLFAATHPQRTAALLALSVHTRDGWIQLRVALPRRDGQP